MSLGQSFQHVVGWISEDLEIGPVQRDMDCWCPVLGVYAKFTVSMSTLMLEANRNAQAGAAA